jgi:hypothetical protein
MTNRNRPEVSRWLEFGWKAEEEHVVLASRQSEVECVEADQGSNLGHRSGNRKCIALDMASDLRGLEESVKVEGQSVGDVESGYAVLSSEPATEVELGLRFEVSKDGGFRCGSQLIGNV